MELVAKGGSRQEAHEEIRVLSHEAGRNVKVEGGVNDLIERIERTPFFDPIKPDLPRLLDPSTFIGRCPEQVVKFLDVEVAPALEKYKSDIEKIGGAELSV